MQTSANPSRSRVAAKLFVSPNVSANPIRNTSANPSTSNPSLAHVVAKLSNFATGSPPVAPNVDVDDDDDDNVDVDISENESDILFTAKHAQNGNKRVRHLPHIVPLTDHELESD